MWEILDKFLYKSKSDNLKKKQMQGIRKYQMRAASEVGPT